MNGDDTKTGLILATILLGGSLLKRKKAEADLTKAMKEKPPLAVVPSISTAMTKAGVTSMTQQVPLPPVNPPTSPAPVVKPTSTQPVSTGLASEILQKLQQLTQKQITPTTQVVTTVLKEPVIEATKPPLTATVPSIVSQPEGTIVLDAKSLVPATTPPTTQVAIVKPIPVVTTAPTVASATTPPPPEQITLSSATQPFVAELDRAIINPDDALGGWLKDIERKVRKEVKRTERKIRKEVKRSPIYKELKRAETSVRKELKRTERRVRHELRRFERRIRKNLAAIATVISVLGYIFPVLKIAAYALDAIVAYRNYALAKTLKKKVEGQQKYVAEVTAETERMLASPTKLATKAKGGTLGYLFKNRINSSFVPLVSVSNTELNDSFYTTMEMLPVLNAAKYIPGKAVGFISKVPFSGSVALQLMYSFEMMDFVTVTGGSRYFQELSKNGYTMVKQLGYVSRQPQEGPHTNKKPTEIERIR